MPDPLFAKLYEDTRQLTAAPLSSIHARARQRRQRRIAMTTASVVALALVGAGGVALAARGAGRTGPQPLASTTPSVSRSAQSPAPAPSTPDASASRARLTTVPLAAMLQPADLGPGPWTVNDSSEAEGDWHFEFTLGYCPAYRSAVTYPDPDQRRLRSMNREPGTTGVIQEVKLYLRTAGAAFDWYRAGAVACARHTSLMGGAETTVEIVAEDVAGDRSMIVRTRSVHGTGMYGFVVVRNLITQFTVAARTEAAGRDLAAKAYARMCAAAGAC